MVKFCATIDQGRGRLIGIGLSRENCKRLLEGQPITFDLIELGLAVHDGGGIRKGQVVIMGGETEEAIKEDVQAGFGEAAHH